MHVCMQIHVQTVIDLHLQSTSPAEYQLEESVRESERKRKGERERDRGRERERETNALVLLWVHICPMCFRR